MVDRVLLGAKGGQYGLYVSRPGVDVKTAGELDLMMSPSKQSVQVITSGIVPSGSNVTITIPNLGFYPLVLFDGQINSYDFDQGIDKLRVSGASSGTYYYVMNIPQVGG